MLQSVVENAESLPNWGHLSSHVDLALEMRVRGWVQPPWWRDLFRVGVATSVRPAHRIFPGYSATSGLDHSTPETGIQDRNSHKVLSKRSLCPSRASYFAVLGQFRLLLTLQPLESPRAAFGNLTTLFAFSICVVIAMLMRSRPAVHKRFMLIASISIMGPAIDRLSLLPPLDGFFAWLFAGISMPPQIVVALVGTLSLLLAMPIHDLVSRRCLHAGTIWSGVCMLLASPAMSAALTFTDVWIAFVRFVG